MVHFRQEQSNGFLVTLEGKELSIKNMSKNDAEPPGSLNCGIITRRLSTGSCDNEGHSTRKKRIPHYLLASTGSCHDVCKYGRRCAFEDDSKVTNRKRVAKPSPSVVKSVERIVSGERKLDVEAFPRSVKASSDAKAQSLRSNALSSGKTCLPRSQSLKSTSLKTPEIRLREVLLPRESSNDQMSKADKKASDQCVKLPSSAVKTKPVKVKSSDGMGRRNSDVQTGRKMRASANKPSASPFLPNKSSLGKTATGKATQSGSAKSLSPGKDQHRMDRVEVETSSNQVSEKTLHVIKIGEQNNPFESAPENHGFPALASLSSPANPYGNGTNDLVYGNTTAMEIGNAHPVKDHNKGNRLFTPSSSKSSSRGRSPSMSSLEGDNEEFKNIGKESVKLISGKNATVKISKATPPRGSPSRNPSKIKEVSSGDKYCKPVKLKFRSGKIMDLHQDSNNDIPRRLIFRRMRSGGISASHFKKSPDICSVKENYKSSRKTGVVGSEFKRRSPMRSFKSEKGISYQLDNNIPRKLKFRRGRIIGVEEIKGDFKRYIKLSGGKDAAEGVNLKIKLKHQDLQGKKDPQYLFNNVIEETATKLVEISRKSKVKALVGAFETVISLQEHKPSLHTAS